MVLPVRSTIAAVLAQHVSDAASLRSTRSVLVSAPHVKLMQLARLDERLIAHFDGLAVAGAPAARAAHAALALPGVGEVFTATVLAITDRDPIRLDGLLSLVEAEPAPFAGLVSAFGWSSASNLRGIISELMTSTSPVRQCIALTACAMHRVSPGPYHVEALRSAHAPTRRTALRVAAQLGQLDLLPACLDTLRSEDCRLQAALSAVLLGDRATALDALRQIAETKGPDRDIATNMLLKVVSPEEAQALLRGLSRDAADTRSLIRAIGTAGDPHFVPWLIKQMDDLKLARLAGEAFSMITGLDLALLDLERKPPDRQELGPNDDAADTDVSMDEDDGLPWPDPQRIAAWWQTHGARFASGTRYFIGEPPSGAHCLTVLRNGYQRQRSAAAQYRCLLTPGTPLFNTAAPAWRQQRMLGAMAT